MKLTPNRVAAFLASVAALAGGLSVAVADMDTTSAAGVIVGILGVVRVFDSWLDGWKKHEARQAEDSRRRGAPPTW